ncbi:hypothetical protein FRC08_018392 [Ceratobasidium sp. 394]|nr:hypothetical protein FRC08_018392 [Ceratobasidium sp. 394]
MGSATLVPNELTAASFARSEFGDIELARLYLEKLNVTCKVLRIDTYPVGRSPILFSPRLTSLEVFTGGFYNYAIDLEDWAQILSQTPSLVHLRLVCFSHWHFGVQESVEAPSRLEIQLFALEKLELSGCFVSLASLFVGSSLPRLEYLLLNFLGRSGTVAPRLATIASVSPFIRQLSISAGLDEWSAAFQHLSRLQEITFFEMGWGSAMLALADLNNHPSLLRVRLEQILDLDTLELDNIKSSRPGLPPIELIDCWDSDAEGPGSDGSESGSNYSSNSCFSPHAHGYPSSEETGSDESERSCGEDEDDTLRENTS